MNTPKVRRGGSFLPFMIIGGVILLWTAPLSLILLVANLEEAKPFAIVSLVLMVVGIVLFIVGIINLKAFKKYRNYVDENAKDSTCRIVKVYMYKSFGRHTTHVYAITVEYKTDSGDLMLKDVSLDVYTWKNLKEDMKIACKVYGNECFINKKYLHVIEEN